MNKLPDGVQVPSAVGASVKELRRLCYLVIDAAKKEADPPTKIVFAARAFALAQEAQEVERRAKNANKRSTIAANKQTMSGIGQS